VGKKFGEGEVWNRAQLREGDRGGGKWARIGNGELGKSEKKEHQW